MNLYQSWPCPSSEDQGPFLKIRKKIGPTPGLDVGKYPQDRREGGLYPMFRERFRQKKGRSKGVKRFDISMSKVVIQTS